MASVNGLVKERIQKRGLYFDKYPKFRSAKDTLKIHKKYNIKYFQIYFANFLCETAKLTLKLIPKQVSDRFKQQVNGYQNNFRHEQ